MNKIKEYSIINETTSFEDRRNSLIKYIKNNPSKSNTYLARKFGYSRQQIIRIKKKLKENESSCLVHGNKSKIPHNKFTDDIRKEIVNKYEDLNGKITKFRDGDKAKISVLDFYNMELTNHIKNISYSTTMRIMNDSLVITPFINKKTKAIIRRTLKDLSKLERLENSNLSPKQIQDKLEELECVVRLCKEKYKYGECVEIDACVHQWFNSKKYHIYHAIESCSGRLLSVWCEKEETNHGYMQLIDYLFKMHGIPTIIKTDKRRSFHGTDEKQIQL